MYVYMDTYKFPHSNSLFQILLSLSPLGERYREKKKKKKKEPRMGFGFSRRGGSAHSHRAGPSQRRRPSIRRAISSFLLCGASSSSSRVMEDCSADLMVNSAKVGEGERLKDERKGSDRSLGRRTSLDGRHTPLSEIPVDQTVPGDVRTRDKGKLLSGSGKFISFQSSTSSSCNGAASASPDCVSATEIANLDDTNDINSIISRDSSQFYEAHSNSNHIPSHCFGEPSPHEVSAQTSIGEAIDSNSEDSSSYFPDSPIPFHLTQDANLRGMMPSTREFVLLEREQNRQQGSLHDGDLIGGSSNMSLSNSGGINGHDLRNYGRSFSRNSVFSTDESDYSGSPDGSHHDFGGDLFSDSLQGHFTSLVSGTHGSNELGWNSRSEFWERLRSSLDTTDTPTDRCPRRIHTGGSCSCRSGLSAEESGSRSITRLVVLAQTLFEVIDQIHQHPMSVSSSVGSLAAPESVVDSLPVKIHTKEEILECAEDISQCHICLLAYEEGDKIRVLPCQHEYHMSCVDKWLKDINGVCPLCRRDVCKGITEVQT